jgi:hypothetical protein
VRPWQEGRVSGKGAAVCVDRSPPRSEATPLRAIGPRTAASHEGQRRRLWADERTTAVELPTIRPFGAFMSSDSSFLRVFSRGAAASQA